MVTKRDTPDALSKKLVVTAHGWHAAGVSPKKLRTLTGSGALVRIRQGVYATRSAVDWAAGDPVRNHVLQVIAARTWAGQDAVASHHSAAVLHRLDLLKSPPSGTVTVTLPAQRRWSRPQAAGVVFRSADLPPEHLTRLYNLPVTTPARTVIDLARTLPFMEAVVVADSALHAEKTTTPELRRTLDSCARWPGVTRARRVVAFADERAGSALESAARVVFDEFGLDPPELQVTIHLPGHAFLADFFWRDPGVIAEADGLAKYADRGDLAGQFQRDRLLRDAGYKVVHFTWRELFKTPALVITRIRQACAPASAY
jgi:predicted transcriptional regulator of viral defense system